MMTMIQSALRLNELLGAPLCRIHPLSYPLSLLFDEMKHQGAAGLSTLSLVAIATNAIR